ncbi:MAG: histidine triad nucleotide-binding protein [Elusimicrobiota bacterium]
MTDAKCLFCKIVNGEIPSKPVFANEEIVAFRDLNPMAPVHILIVPKKHIPALSEARAEDQEVLGAIQIAAKTIAAEQKLEGFRLVLNNGKLAGQTVDHVHYHLLAGRRMSWPPG